MDRHEAQQKLRKAKTAHLKWRTYAQALASGVKVDETKAPLDHTECEFGRWYNGPGQELREISDLYDDIAEPHRILHETYAELYQLVQAKKFRKASEKLVGLEGISRSLIDIIDSCIEDIRDA